MNCENFLIHLEDGRSSERALSHCVDTVVVVGCAIMVKVGELCLHTALFCTRNLNKRTQR